MNIHPQFSGVYLEPSNRAHRKPSTTGYKRFEHEGKSYYTTHQDTVTLRQAKRDKMPKDQLNELYGTLAAKAPQATVPSLAGIIASRITESVTQGARSERSRFQPRAVSRVISQSLEENLDHHMDTVAFSSPRQELARSGVDESIIDEVETGLSSLNKQG